MSYIIAFVTFSNSTEQYPVECFRTDIKPADNVIVKLSDGRLAAATVVALKATLNKPSKISAQTWMTQFFGLLCLSRGPFGQFAGR